MGIVVNTNSTAMFTNMYLGKSNEGTKESMQHLSSGYRINSAKDDAAGMQIADQLDAQARGLTVALRNGGDALSVAQIAEGGMNEQTAILLRMNDLALQSANGSNGPQQREALDAEFAQLQDELSRIANTTSFGSQKLINGFYGTQAFQIGANAYETIDVTMVNASASALGFEYRTTVAADIDIIGGREDIALNHGDIEPQNEVPILQIKVDDDINEIELDYSMTAQDLQDKINSIEGLSTATVSIAPDTGYERVNPANASHINDLTIASYPPALVSSDGTPAVTGGSWAVKYSITNLITADASETGGSLKLTLGGVDIEVTNLSTVLAAGNSESDLVSAFQTAIAAKQTDLDAAGYTVTTNGADITIAYAPAPAVGGMLLGADALGASSGAGEGPKWTATDTTIGVGGTQTLKFTLSGTDENDAGNVGTATYESGGNTNMSTADITPKESESGGGGGGGGSTTTYGAGTKVVISSGDALAAADDCVLTASWGGVNFIIDKTTTGADTTPTGVTDADAQVQNVYTAWAGLASSSFEDGYSIGMVSGASPGTYDGIQFFYDGEDEDKAKEAPQWTVAAGSPSSTAAYSVAVEDATDSSINATITVVKSGGTPANAADNANALSITATPTVTVAGTLGAPSVGASNNNPGQFQDGSQADYGVEYDLSSYAKPTAGGGLKFTLNSVELYNQSDLETNVADASTLVTQIVAGYSGKSTDPGLANYEVKANASGEGIIILSKSPAAGAKTEYSWELSAGTAPDGSITILGKDLVADTTAAAPSAVTMTGGSTIAGSPGPGLDADLTKYVDNSGGGGGGGQVDDKTIDPPVVTNGEASDWQIKYDIALNGIDTLLGTSDKVTLTFQDSANVDIYSVELDQTTMRDKTAFAAAITSAENTLSAVPGDYAITDGSLIFTGSKDAAGADGKMTLVVSGTTTDATVDITVTDTLDATNNTETYTAKSLGADVVINTKTTPTSLSDSGGGGGGAAGGSAIAQAWAAQGLTQTQGAQARITNFTAASNPTTPETITMAFKITMVDGSTALAQGIEIDGDAAASQEDIALALATALSDTTTSAFEISDATKMANAFDFTTDSVGYEGKKGDVTSQNGRIAKTGEQFGALFIDDGTFNGLNNIGKIEVWQTAPTVPDSDNTLSFTYGNDVDDVIFSAGNPSAVGEDYGFKYRPTAGVTPALFTISFDTFKVDSDVESVRIIQEQSNVNESLVLSDLTFLRSVGGVNIRTFEAAQEAMYAVIDAMNQIDEARADLGAIQNRVIHANNNNENIRVNVTEAESRIKDLDFASESTQLAKFQVLQQTGAAMLVQANQITELAISLVRG